MNQCKIIYIENYSKYLFAFALILFSFALLIFLIEINLSSKALKTHLEDIGDKENN